MATPRGPAAGAGRIPAARLLLPAGLGILTLAAAALRAWNSDDAYLTFRTIENLLGGHGLRWNVAERVQAYTHPLWMMLMTGARLVTGEYFFSSIVLSLALTAGALVVLSTRVARAPDRASLALALLLVSRAFLDYATSGLENALAFLLLALLLWALLRPGGPEPAALFRMSLLAALLAITRLDLLALVAPALAWRLLRAPARRTILPVALGAIPLLAWEAFSIVYYGFPLPNTAYAKLATSLPRAGLIRHGVQYLVSSLLSDPVTLPAIGAGALAALWPRGAVHGAHVGAGARDAAARGESTVTRALGAGIVLHLLYVVWVGGDFMSGRFLTAPLFVAAALLAVRVPEGPIVRAAACAIALFLGAWPGTSPFVFRPPSPPVPAVDARGIADERLLHFGDGWIGNARSQEHWPNPDSYRQAQEIRASWTEHTWLPFLKFHGVVDRDELEPWLPPGADTSYRKVIVRSAVGVLGYHLGPEYHVLDFVALGEPLLARLPALDPDPLLASFDPALASLDYRPGHYVRRIPAGYYETLLTGESRIRDPRLAEYFDHLALVTRGPLFDARRLAEIWKLNTGQHQHLLRAGPPAPAEARPR